MCFYVITVCCLHCHYLPELGAVDVGIGKHLEQHRSVALSKDELAQPAVELGSISSSKVSDVVLSANSLSISLVRRRNKFFARRRQFQVLQVAENGTPAVVYQQNAQVAFQLLLPQGVAVVEKAQVARYAECATVGSQTVAAGCRQQPSMPLTPRLQKMWCRAKSEPRRTTILLA